MNRRMSRRAITTLAAAVALLATTSVGAASVAVSGGGRSVVATGPTPTEPPSTRTGALVATTVTVPAPPIPTTVVTRPTPTALKPAVTLLPALLALPLPAAGVDPTYGRLPPGAVVVPYQPGQSEWSGISGGVAIRLQMSPAQPRAGDTVRFVVEATSNLAPCCGVALLFGDGYQFASDMGYPCPGGGPSGPGTKRAETTHVYNGARRWTFMVSAVTGNCAVAGGNGDLLGSFDVAPGVVTTGQGPSKPTARVDTWGGVTDPPRAANEVQLWVEAADADGFVSGFRIEWGDGTRDDGLGDPLGCLPTESGWPRPSWTWLPRGGGPPAHRYTQPGTYQVTVTASSTGCDGSDTQQATATMAWTWS